MRLETIRRPFWPTLRGNQFEYPLFWQLKIQPRNGVHSVDALVLYGNTIYSVRGILFNGINPDRITPDRRLPEATQSTLHHYFITSYTEVNTYLLIIDKFPAIRYQTTVKQSALIFDDASWPACSQTITIVLFCSKESTISSRLLTDLNSFVAK